MLSGHPTSNSHLKYHDGAIEPSRYVVRAKTARRRLGYVVLMYLCITSNVPKSCYF